MPNVHFLFSFSWEFQQWHLNLFDKIWYQGLRLKLNSYGIKENFLDLMIYYLHCQMQQPVLNRQCSSSSLPVWCFFKFCTRPAAFINWHKWFYQTTFIFEDNTSLFFPVIDNFFPGTLIFRLQVSGHINEK